MLREGPIPKVVHGAIEYLLGILFLAGPILFDFDSATATGVSIAVGVLVLVTTAITADLPTSLVGQLALTAHVTVDFVLAIFLVAAPFLLGFSDESAPRNFFMILGVVLLLMTIGTRFRERTEQAAG
jgi:TRAP-type mannitol/chloroaromatic compound transport system permease large subunit